MAQTLIIGDIHGCHDELQDLLAAAGLAAEDRIVSLGDMVDRGPQDAAVVRFFRDHPQADAIRGNHEHKHTLQRAGLLRVDLSQQIARRRMGEAEHAAFCTWAAELPLHHQLPEALLVHGFVEPGVALEDQQPQVLLGLTSGERHLQETLSAPWYTQVEHPTPIIVGHRDYHRSGQPLVYQDRVFGLDTTVYAGGRLTGLLLPAFRLISVPARADHWTVTRTQNADLRYEQTPLESLTWDRARAVLAAYRRHPPVASHHRQRQGRLAAMMHAAEAQVQALLAELEAAASLPPPDRERWIAQHPHGRLLARQIHGTPVDGPAVERYLRRPSDALIPQALPEPQKSH